MWVAKFEEVLPVFVIKAGERGKDENGFAIRNGVVGSLDIVEMVMDYRGWRLYSRRLLRSEERK